MSRATDFFLRQHQDSLGAHLRQCRTLSDSRQRALCSLEALDAAVGHRMFTTVVLGSVRAQADSDRRMDSVRGALRAAAARAGATSLVGVRCIAADGEQTCIASIAAPEVDEQAAGDVQAAVASPLAGSGR